MFFGGGFDGAEADAINRVATTVLFGGKVGAVLPPFRSGTGPSGMDD